MMFVYEITTRNNAGQSHMTYVVAERAADVRAWIAGMVMTKKERATATKWHATEWSWKCRTKNAAYRIAKMDADAFGASPIKHTATVCPSTRKARG